MLPGMAYRDSNNSRQPRENGFYALKPGALATVKNCANGYLLPAGLKGGDTVKIVNFDWGYYTVEREGATFSVFLANIDQ